MPKNVAQQLIADHLVDGTMTPGEDIALAIDQTLTQDATGTLVMQELEALGVRRTRAEVSVQYVDHNLLQADERNAEDHDFLRGACRRYGIWFSKPGNGVSHPTHMQRFGVPGATLVGSDSHTCAAGSLGMLAIGVGGLEVARIHWQNLANFGIVALEFADASDYDRIEQGDELTVENLRDQLANGTEVTVRGKDREFRCTHRLSPRQVEAVLAGGVIARIAQPTNA